MEKLDIILVGVGGQGTLLASDVVAAAGQGAGYDVKKSEVHGMSQRGGSVISQVRWGRQVASPLIGRGEADLMLAFEKCEAARFAPLLRPGATIIVNDFAIPPVSVNTGAVAYPTDEQIRAALAEVSPHVHFIAGIGLAEELGNSKANNIVLVGALSHFVPIPADVWLAAIAGRVPARTLAVNQRAFAAGREAAEAWR